MSVQPRRVDVAIIGGGPAGATCALKLTELGMSVALLEKGESKRQHTGESLPSSIRVVLDTLGLELPESVVVARPPEHLVYWGPMQGGGRRPSAAETSLLVWRGPFDTFLRDTAVTRGVELLSGAVRSCRRTPDGHEVTTIDGSALEAKFLVDASGRAGIVARRYRRRETAFRTLSLTAHYRTDEADPPTIVEAIPFGWIWSSPVRDGVRDVTAMLDSRRDHREAIDASTRVRDIVGEAPLEGPVRGTDATPYTSTRFCDRDVALIGDAGSFLDPLSAHGVHKAMDGAVVAAICIRTILERPDMQADAASFLDAREHNIYAITKERLARLYRQESRFAAEPFWSARSGDEITPPLETPKPPLRPGMKLRARNGIVVGDSPVLEDDFIERRRVLSAKGQPRPVRFLGSVSLPEIFESACREETAADAARSSSLPYDDAYRAIDWLYRSGYLDEAGSLLE